MDNKKHLEASGPFVGLWVRTAKALRKAGYTSRAKVMADVQAGVLSPFVSIHDYGKRADEEVRSWLGLEVARTRPGTVKARIVRHGMVKYGSLPPPAKKAKTKLTAKEQAIAAFGELQAVVAKMPDADKFAEVLAEIKAFLK